MAERYGLEKPTKLTNIVFREPMTWTTSFSYEVIQTIIRSGNTPSKKQLDYSASSKD